MGRKKLILTPEQIEERKEKKREYDRIWRKNNVDKARKYQRKAYLIEIGKYEEVKEKRAESARKQNQTEERKAYMREYIRKYRKEHKEQCQINEANSYKRLKGENVPYKNRGRPEFPDEQE